MCIRDSLHGVAEHEREREQHGGHGEPHLHDVHVEDRHGDEEQDDVERGQDDPVERREDARGAVQRPREVPPLLVNLHEPPNDLRAIPYKNSSPVS